MTLGFVLTVGGVSVYFSFFSSNFEKTILENIEALASIKKKNIDILVDQGVDAVKEADTIEEFKYNDGSFDPVKAKLQIDHIKKSSNNIEEVFLLDKKNIVLLSSNLTNIGTVSDIIDSSVVLNNSEPTILGLKKEGESYYYTILLPIVEYDNTIKYYFAIKYNDYLLLGSLNSREGLKSTGESLMAIKVGDEISFVNERRFATNNQKGDELATPMQEALNKKSGVLSDTLDYRGEPVIAAYSYIDSLDAGLVLKIDEAEALGFIDRMILLSVIVAIIITLLVYLATRIISRKLSAPIEELNKAVAIIAEGNWDYKINLEGSEEIEETAKAFNTMAMAIKESHKTSEKQILEQTKSLREQQMAILNILEDVEAEKEKVADTARELEKFRQAVENTSDHVVITDPEGIIIYANKAVETITGFNRKDILGTKVGTKQNWGGFMGQDFYQNLWDTLKKSKKSFSGYINNIRKNGEEYEALANISPVFDAGGNVIFFVGIERDFTREREIDRAKSEFVSLASHQLRTPLSTVNWYAEILLSEDAGKINDEQREYLNEVYKGNQRMVNLVNALLNVSRIDLGTLSIDPEPTDLIDLAQSVLKELELKIKERGHKIVKVFDKDVPKINLDPKMMRIVWQNYLTNAVKYTRQDGTIEVGIKKKKTLAEIYVKDNGMGIPEIQQDKIFKKLFRADNARESETDGTGLGLYIVKSIVEEFGGKVWFDSKENKGTTFFATIPLAGVKPKAGSKGLEYVD